MACRPGRLWSLWGRAAGRHHRGRDFADRRRARGQWANLHARARRRVLVGAVHTGGNCRSLMISVAATITSSAMSSVVNRDGSFARFSSSSTMSIVSFMVRQILRAAQPLSTRYACRSSRENSAPLRPLAVGRNRMGAARAMRRRCRHAFTPPLAQAQWRLLWSCDDGRAGLARARQAIFGPGRVSPQADRLALETRRG